MNPNDITKLSNNKNLLSCILTYCSPKDLSKLRQVNKTFNKICLNNDIRWREECFKLYLTSNSNHR